MDGSIPETLIILFQSTPSAWRVTSSRISTALLFRFQSTPSAWRVTCVIRLLENSTKISIHTLRVEGDFS